MDLNTKIQYLSGVGPKMATKLDRLGIEILSDLIFYYPRTYKDFSDITKISDIRYSNKEAISIKGTMLGIANKKTSRRGFAVTEAVVEDGTGSLKVIWFNQPFLAKMLIPGREVILNGKAQYNFFAKEVVMESPERATKPSIIPVYSETAGITSRYIAKLVLGIKDQLLSIKEWLPSQILERYSLLSIEEALLNIHQPENREMLEQARRRIAFDELFMIALRANLSREELKKENAPKITIAEEKITGFVKNLPFELTGDQKKSAWQIIKDIGLDKPMNRLLNGDVGSGKTVVAAIAAFIAVKAGYKVAIMAPTSILANQHYETFQKLFEKEDISIGLYTRERKETGNELNSKIKVLKSNIIIGTQALIQKDVELENIGLVVVDEQHRFGVKQRATLLELRTAQKMRPHFLSMTATPIPRTMHLALFGDLDLSIIKEKPKDRKEIQTRFVEKQNREKAYEFIRKQIKVGRQAFIICPLIEENTNGVPAMELFAEDKKTVVKEHEKLQKIFPEFKIGMLHGRLKSKEKDEVMEEFSNNRLNILVSTSVVEVGVDVPNATVMMIEDADRFGLAQIHQFRGRVGRAEHQSFCFLFSPTINSRAIKRLKDLEVTSDGFKLAEIDLETRGPGAVFGTEQSGLLDLKMASFSDRMLIEEASSAAKSITEDDPELKEHPLIKERVKDFLQNKHLE
ncbi:MAG: ATP-dependent DNA helicase RecG [Patescibacteria group bacterium]|nr:ATP-dependent DNA helicase RecG [Patescibacteria group bacterium]